MMSKKMEAIINMAIRNANTKRHEYITLESILYELLDDDQVCDVLRTLDCDVDEVKEELKSFLETSENVSILSEQEIEELGKQQFADENLRKIANNSGVFYQPEISMSLQRVIQRAAVHVQSSGKRYITGVNLLAAMFDEKESYALYCLEKRGVSKFEVLRVISHEMGGQEDLIEESLGHGEEEEDRSYIKEKKRSFLDLYTTELNELARQGKIDPVVGREEEIERIVQILCRRRKNNPLLVGEAGVGKTAIAEGLALAVVNGEIPKILDSMRVFSLDMASLLAGAKYRGDFEQRIKGVLKDLQSLEDTGATTLLLIDEIHTVMGAGSTSGGSMDASNLLKPALSSGQVRVIGSTTHDEYRKFIEKDAAFSRRFQKVDVDEPSDADTVAILRKLRPRFEEHHGVSYSDDSLQAIVDMSGRYITDRKNPDKSIDVLDEAGAIFQVKGKTDQEVDLNCLEQVVSKLARIPHVSVASDEKEKLRDLKKNLKMVIYGQDDAVDRVSDAILLARSGLGHENKPMASFLFAGPTGVGKTELAKQLARELGGHLERFDMSEYMEKHAVSKLIGAPPGYVGHDQGGILTDAVKKNPYCVLLLDEIEKAHQDIYNILLQVMDNGTLTDSQGRTTDFQNAVIIMTTNAGASEMESGSIGLSSSGSADNVGTHKRDRVIKNFFSPEFRNRLDGIVHFKKLSQNNVLQVVDKFLTILESKLLAKNVVLKVSSALREWLSVKGFDPKMGARPMQRIIDEEIKKPLSHEILFGKLAHGGDVLCDLEGEKVVFSFDVSKKL